MSGRNHHRKQHQQPPDRAGRVLRRPRYIEGPLVQQAHNLMWQAAQMRAQGWRVLGIAVLPSPRVVAVREGQP